MALALERMGWSNADHWVRMQGSYDLAQAWLRDGSPERAWESCGHQLASSTCAVVKSSMASKMPERRSIFLCCSRYSA